MAKLTLTRKNQLYNTYFLTGDEWLLGSNPSCSVRIDDPAILPQHARITHTNGEYRIIALGEGAEIRVNHGHAQQHTLREGDTIHLEDYHLVFSENRSADDGQRSASRPVRAWLQVLNGMHRGRIIRLENPVTRFGSAGDLTVMISRRADGYYLSHLEGEEFPQVNRTSINDTTWPLNQGDTIQMGKLKFAYHAEYDATEHAASTGEGQRNFTRVSLHNPAIIASRDHRWNTRLMDLSLSGALLEHPTGWMGKTGDHFRLMLQLANESYLEVGAQVRQIDTDRLGMAFVNLEDTELEEIRWLVEVNLGDPALLRRELSEIL